MDEIIDLLGISQFDEFDDDEEYDEVIIYTEEDINEAKQNARRNGGGICKVSE
ncbi:MAG: hypothetical protein LUE12_03500 [Ruminococcus sp.]|nr:hypothetical protein [Ruminococcus sp.]